MVARDLEVDHLTDGNLHPVLLMMMMIMIVDDPMMIMS